MKKLGLIHRPVPASAPNLRMHAINQTVAPDHLDRSHIAYTPQLFGNGDCGDCTIAGLANALLAQSALSGFGLNIPTSKVLAKYSTLSGYNPSDPATDTGLVEVDVLADQITNGFDTGDQTPFAGLWATIDPANLNQMMVAMAQLGVAYLGLTLRVADQADGVLDTVDGDQTTLWGGHCAISFGYTGKTDTDLVELDTWGERRQVTVRWIKSRMTECHALVHRQLMTPQAVNGCGLSWDRLSADCASFQVAA